MRAADEARPRADWAVTHGDAGDEDGDHSRNCDRVIKEHGGLVAARSEMIFCCCFICYFPFFSHRHNSQSREGVSCAAVLPGKTGPPVPVLHPGRPGG